MEKETVLYKSGSWNQSNIKAYYELPLKLKVMVRHLFLRFINSIFFEWDSFNSILSSFHYEECLIWGDVDAVCIA